MTAFCFSADKREKLLMSEKPLIERFFKGTVVGIGGALRSIATHGGEKETATAPRSKKIRAPSGNFLRVPQE
jgi:hypothetical protein